MARLQTRAVLAAALAGLTAACSACAAFDPSGRILPISSEDILIVWDEAKGRQHLIRSLDWEQSGPAGFLVPTPSRPEVGEASAEALGLAHSMLMDAEPQSWGCGLPVGESVAAGAVEVLERKSVAGYDAAILKSDDAGALAGWLKQEGFPVNPKLEKWLEPYVEKGFHLAAFRYEDAPQLSQAVRISFDTPRLWHPYREPEGAGVAHSRSFRATILSPKPMTASLENGSSFRGSKRDWNAVLNKGQASTLAQAAGLPDVKAEGWHLSQFTDDNAGPRPDSDLVFVPEPPSPALWIMAATAIALAAAVRAIRLRRAKQAPAEE